MGKDGYHIGLDVGSVSANTVLIDEEKKVVEEHYTRTKGQPLQIVLAVLTEIFSRVAPDRISGVSVTGAAGKLIAELLGAEVVNEIIAQAKPTPTFSPPLKTSL